MEIHQHRRPLWIGFVASAITPPAAYCALARITLLRLPSLMAPAQAYRVMELIFLVGLIFSSAMTFSIGLFAVAWLKKQFRLNAIYVCATGALTGALFAFLLRRGAELRTTATMHVPLSPALNSSALGAMAMPAWVGLVAAAALCLVSGIPVRSVCREQMRDDEPGQSASKLGLAFAILVFALSALVLKPLVAPLFSTNKMAFPNMPATARRAVDAKSWDRTCPKEHASPDDSTIEPIDTDVAQLVIQTKDGDTTGRRRFTQFAEDGNELAQYRLGMIYDAGCHEGLGVPQDTTQAAHWLELAFRQGNAESASALGVLHQRGDLLPKDQALAVYWFNQANTSGERNTFVVRGQLIRKVVVNGLPEWPAQIRDVVAQTRTLAEQGNAEAQNEMGEMIERGMAGPVDFTQAASWFQKSAMQGYAAGQRNLGILYKNGVGVSRGTTQTLSWLTNAANQNDAMAAYELGNIYRFGALVPKNLAAAAHWYSVAAEHGSVPGQGALATLYAQGDGLPKDDAKAWQWFLIFSAHDQDVGISYDFMGQVEPTITPGQLLVAKQAAREWWKSHPLLTSSLPL
jgi:TPR repeat protein